MPKDKLSKDDINKVEAAHYNALRQNEIDRKNEKLSSVTKLHFVHSRNVKGSNKQVVIDLRPIIDLRSSLNSTHNTYKQTRLWGFILIIVAIFGIVFMTSGGGNVAIGIILSLVAAAAAVGLLYFAFAKKRLDFIETKSTLEREESRVVSEIETLEVKGYGVNSEKEQYWLEEMCSMNFPIYGTVSAEEY